MIAEEFELHNCPVCKTKAVISRDAPDGFFLGYSVGCPRYKKNDGIHSQKMHFHNVSTKEKAIEKWNEYCEVYENESH